MAANWHWESSRKIDRRIVITGTLVLETPATFSNGEVIGTELVILEDALKGGPLIPGASLAGALRHYLLIREKGYRAADDGRSLATRLFGEALDDDKERVESRVIVSDARGSGTLTRREGVKIAGDTRTADEHMLFSAQVWEADTTFDLRIELVLYENDSDEFIEALAGTLLALERGEIPLGGRKNRGYGRVSVREWRVCVYDMTNPIALSAWLQNHMRFDDIDNTEAFFALGTHFVDQRQYVRVETTLQLCDSLLIRAPSHVADSEQLTSRDKPILSGTSLAGALRARALKIANIIVNETHAMSLVNGLFGKHGAEDDQTEQRQQDEHGAEGDSEGLSASRIRVEEHPIEGGIFKYIQNRVKIDRFTGGAFETALFTERPLFANGNTSVRVNFEIQYPADAEIGLLLLVLKDLWTEDLPLGGESSIGRGRLQGQSGTLTLKFGEEPIIIHLDKAGLPDTNDRGYLEGFVEALWNYQGESA